MKKLIGKLKSFSKAVESDMKTLFLHIGNPKTATTAIQEYSYKNPEALRNDGLCYSMVGREEYKINHKAFHFSILKEIGKPYKNPLNVHIENFEHYLCELKQEIANSESKIFLISFEGLAGLSMYEEAKAPLKKLIDYLSSVCELKVVLYVRSPWESLLSNYNERCKRKNFTGPFFDFTMDSHDIVLDQTIAYEYFCNIFGEKKVVLKKYGDLKGEEFIGDFFNSLGVSHKVKNFSSPVNASLSFDTIEFSRIKAVLDLELPEEKERSLLYGKRNIDNADFLSFINRLDKINKKNETLFKYKLSCLVDPILIADIMKKEREFNVDPLRKFYMNTLRSTD